MKLIEHRKIRKANVHAGETVLTEFYGSLKNLVSVMRSQKVGLRNVSWLRRMFINENEGVEKAASFIVNHILEQDGDSFVGRIKGFEAWRGELTGFLEGNTRVKNKNVNIQKCERFKHEAKSWKNSLDGAVKCLERIKARVNTAKQSFKAVYGNDSGIDSPAVSSAIHSLVSALDNIISEVNGFDYIDELKDDGYFMLALDKMIDRLTVDEPGSPEEDGDTDDDHDDEEGESIEEEDSDPSDESENDDEDDEEDDEDEEEEDEDSGDEDTENEEEEDEDDDDNEDDGDEKDKKKIETTCNKIKDNILQIFNKFALATISAYDTDSALNRDLGENFRETFSEEKEQFKTKLDNKMEALHNSLKRLSISGELENTTIINSLFKDFNKRLNEDLIGDNATVGSLYYKYQNKFQAYKNSTHDPITELMTIVELKQKINDAISEVHSAFLGKSPKSRRK